MSSIGSKTNSLALSDQDRLVITISYETNMCVYQMTQQSESCERHHIWVSGLLGVLGCAEPIMSFHRTSCLNSYLVLTIPVATLALTSYGSSRSIWLMNDLLLWQTAACVRWELRSGKSHSLQLYCTSKCLEVVIVAYEGKELRWRQRFANYPLR